MQTEPGESRALSFRRTSSAAPRPVRRNAHAVQCRAKFQPLLQGHNGHMRTSQFLLSTLKETPSDAVVISHQLMLRAGMIRKLASGLYTWMPMGLRALRKAEAIVREEMNKAGALAVLMPAIQPAELWQDRKSTRLNYSH